MIPEKEERRKTLVMKRAPLPSSRAIVMEREIERHPDQVASFGTLPKQEAQLTRRSLVMRDLDLAASTSFLATHI